MEHRDATGSAGPAEPADPLEAREPALGTRPLGVWFGIDVGSVRVGVARSDPRGVLAVPVATLRRDPSPRAADLDQLVGLLAEYDAVGVVIGLPRTLAGRDGPAVESARAYASALDAKSVGIPIRFVDERMTTVVAQRNLSQSGVRGRSQRAVVDQAAAVAILQSFLDSPWTEGSDRQR